MCAEITPIIRSTALKKLNVSPSNEGYLTDSARPINTKIQTELKNSPLFALTRFS
jgi:hypothetical protein